MPIILLKLKYDHKKNLSKKIINNIKYDVKNIVKNKTFDNIYISYKISDNSFKSKYNS